jgi:hypothetical protein
MPKKRIVAYLQPEIFNLLTQYQESHNLPIGEALEQLIAKALGATDTESDRKPIAIDRIANLEEQVTVINHLLVTLQETVRSICDREPIASASPYLSTTDRIAIVNAIANETGMIRASELQESDKKQFCDRLPIAVDREEMKQAIATDRDAIASPETEEVDWRHVETQEVYPGDSLFEWKSVSVDDLQSYCPDFWQWMWDRAEQYNANRVKKGKPFIDPAEVALKKCQDDGHKFYTEWLSSNPEIQAIAPKYLLEWSEDIKTWQQAIAPDGDLSDVLTRISASWDTLGLNWVNQDIINWIDRARAIDPKIPGNNRNLGMLPDWVLFKLAFDLDQAISNRSQSDRAS